MAIRIETLAPGVCHLTIDGRIEKTDIGMAMAAITAAKSESERINMLVDVRGFAGIEMAALIEDLRQGFNELRDISRYDRVAVVTEKSWMEWTAKTEGALLPGVSIRTFQADQMDLARRYVLGETVVEQSEAPALHLIQTDRPDALAFSISGRLTRTDIKAFSQLLEEKLRSYKEIDVMVRLDKKMPRFDPTVLFSGNSWATKFSAWRHLRRYALVGAPQMLGGATDFLGAMMPFDVRTFTVEREEDAWKWIGAAPLAESGPAAPAQDNAGAHP
ncbi:STAS/SEC14 domain-containing protein [Notoacmeibacter sp. MSK16QG-6]|uniref:STAS/SEC14 domain-containing protein n=1 Tax=Notoacmeibacter sp. MSK16QG-6 TaxID=2957982 RepID=UPI00209E8FD4|nr:STAS/SEC14 domain-containing protein [Notoacmeibacter sp. MSK16QG-6]MCP1199639.1 STAS/SEC14 domain-containing protein [Notoacmeibacter sp. MSK16QG-6]